MLFSWAMRGTPAAEPNHFATQIGDALQSAGVATSRSTRMFKGVEINRVISSGEDLPAILVSASNDNTVLAVDSQCVRGDFEDYQ